MELETFINKFKGCKIKLIPYSEELEVSEADNIGLQSKYVSDQIVVLPTEL